MTDLAHLIQDLRAHAHEAPAVCAALMRRAATELEHGDKLAALAALTGGKHRHPREHANAAD
jgi:hypothetical protein